MDRENSSKGVDPKGQLVVLDYVFKKRVDVAPSTLPRRENFLLRLKISTSRDFPLRLKRTTSSSYVRSVPLSYTSRVSDLVRVYKVPDTYPNHTGPYTPSSLSSLTSPSTPPESSRTPVITRPEITYPLPVVPFWDCSNSIHSSGTKTGLPKET